MSDQHTTQNPGGAPVVGGADESPAARDRQPEVTVHVNNQPVVLSGHRVRGLQVKRAAIAQGLAIEEEFILVVETHHGTHPVSDTDVVTVTKHTRFEANADDDNS